MGRLLQTQNRLYSLKKQNPIFSAQLWKARLQASVKKPDLLVTAATQRLWETSVSLRIDKPGFFLIGWKQQKHFSLVSLFFCQPNTSGPIYSVAFGLYPASVIYPRLHLAGYSPQLIWRTWGFILSNPCYLVKPQGRVLNLYSSIMKTY